MAKKKEPKKVTRYTHDDASDPRTPETGHTALLPEEEQVITLDMDNGWSEALEVATVEDDRTVLIDMDPAVDPVLMWAGKRNRREVPVLPLQRNEVISESRIAQIVGRAREAVGDESSRQVSLFADLEKDLREGEKDLRVEFYTHEEEWKNKLICGDSLPVMESLLRYEGLAGNVQMIYFDPPYGIGYNSNFQQRVDSTANTLRDEGDDVLTIRAFRDTWSLGPHSYLSNLAERLYLARELLSDSGSIFVQCNVVNMHRIRLLLDEVFGAANCASVISWKKAAPETSFLKNTTNYLLWYVQDRRQAAARAHKLYRPRRISDGTTEDPRKLALWGEFAEEPPRTLTTEEKRNPELLPRGTSVFRVDKLTNKASSGNRDPVEWEGKSFTPGAGNVWKTDPEGMQRLIDAGRVIETRSGLSYRFYLDDNPVVQITNLWDDTAGKIPAMIYSVQTNRKLLDRCIAASTEPGDLVLDPTSGSGTAAFAAERLGRRWVAIDVSRVAINVARQRLLASVYPYYQLKDSHPGSGFWYETVERLTMSTIADGKEPGVLELVDKPLEDKTALRVSGPFEVLTLGRYSLEDWKGYLMDPDGQGAAAGLQNYVEVITLLYRPKSESDGGAGLIHAIEETTDGRLGLSVGPLTGRVTARQIHDAHSDAQKLGLPIVHVLGWAFEANVGEVKTKLESDTSIEIQLVMIRPDTLAEGLKVTTPSELFSPLSLPEIEVNTSGRGRDRRATVTLNGVGLFNREDKTTDYYKADSGYIAAWYIDEDYDGDCFVDCQMFFDFKKAPNLTPAVGNKVDPAEFELTFTSEAFPIGKYKRLAVKVVDVYGNESTVVRDI